MVDEGYITLAWGRAYADVAPLTGSLAEASGQRLSVAVTVEREAA